MTAAAAKAAPPVIQGKSYKYVVVPAGGLRVAGVSFPAGPRASGKAWARVLVEAGCREITEREFSAMQAAGSAAEEKTDAQRPVQPRGRSRKAQARG